MGLINPTIPTLGDQNATEDPDVRNALITILAEFNGHIADSNVDTNAQIQHSKLANAAAGRLLIANGSGIITATASGGDVTVDSSGNFTIGNDKVTNAKMADNSVGSAEIIDGSVGAPEILDNSVGTAEIGTLPSARVFNSASVSVPNTTFTALACDSETFDTATIHDTVTNNSRLTIPVTGVYIINGQIQWDTNVAGNNRTTAIWLNGATQITANSAPPASNVPAISHYQTATTIYKLNAGDYVQLMAYQDSGGSRSVTPQNFNIAWLNDG